MCAPREPRKRRAGARQLQAMLEREIIGVSANGWHCD
jgi:hypothetical protein